jgi:translation initiation factor IF-2
MRVHELAKELDISSKELLACLHDLGADAKSHMSTIDDTAIELARGHFSKDEPSSPPAEPEAPAAEKPEPAVEENVASVDAPESADKANVIHVKGPIVVREFAKDLNIRPNRLIAELMGFNVLASITQTIDVAIARKIAEKHGFALEQERRAADHKPSYAKRAEEQEVDEDPEDPPEDLQPRPPVVTFLGHVDHGKTSLLDCIRDTAVAKGESGGITQHIGASTVDVGGRQITFLDTPGHEAFTAMRARGANLTDIAVIVIAADDGIMPQTKEAIQHAQAAGVALMVAINKIDLPGANADRVRQQLQADGLSPEDWGGETICCEVSAETGDGISHLLEMILLQSEVLELNANPRRRATGFVIEAQLEPGMGPTCTLLVTRGTLSVGDVVLCGPHCGRVKALINDHGIKIKSAPPSAPAKCLGLSGVPEAGSTFRVCKSEKAARILAQQAMAKQKESQLSAPRKASLDNLFEQISQEKMLELNIILKTDAQGSEEAIRHALQDIQSDKISLNIVLGGTGNITVNDVMLASASNAVIIGFHISQEPGVPAAARHEGVEIHLHSVIYELIDHVRNAMTGMLAPEIRETVRGHAEVKAIFPLGKRANVAGCMITDGMVTPRYRVRVTRDGEVLHDGTIASLKHFQEEAAQLRESQECGVRLENFMDFIEGDILEFYELEEVEQTL